MAILPTATPADVARLRALGQAIEQFLSAGMLPYWARNGWDAGRGGLHERLAADGTPILLGYRRLTVVARQLFVFSLGARDFPGTPSRAAAHLCFEYLLTRFRDEAHGGWYFKVDLDGRPVDPTKDLYAGAFVVLGLAAYAAVLGVRDAAGLALDTLVLLQDKLGLPGRWLAASATGDWHIQDRSLLANPHMHLLEAALLLHQSTGAEPARQVAGRVVDLYAQRLVDPATGSLCELFDEAGRPHPTKGRIREPGHHFEWYWLLHRLPGEACAELASARDRMLAWGWRHGTDPRFGGVFDQVDDAGRPLQETKRIWPVTEGIKAFAAAYGATQQAGDLDRMATLLKLMFDRYVHMEGTWIEVLNRDLSPLRTWMPPTTCYHLYLGLMEAKRLIGDLVSPAVHSAQSPGGA